jgi:trehalose 6-phosphate phosphatase
MRYVLGPAGRRALRRFSRSGPLLAFDYDGTLAPIVGDPERADMRAATRELLTRLAARYVCVVVSGRPRRDLIRRLTRVGIAEVIGNHGIEPWKRSARTARVVRHWRRQLIARLPPLDGVMIEDKAYSISLHYRQARDQKRARAAVLEAAAALDGARLIAGKRSVSILPTFAPNKGVAVEEARSRFGCNTAVFVGDDTTDEDVFALNQPSRLLTIRVGRRLDSAAQYYVRNQPEIDTLLARLLALADRKGREGGKGKWGGRDGS